VEKGTALQEPWIGYNRAELTLFGRTQSHSGKPHIA